MNYPHLAVLVHRQAQKYGDKVALTYRNYETSHWLPITWNQFSQAVKVVSNSMVEINIHEEENIGVFSQNMPECLYTDFAAFANRAITIPMYATSSASQIQYIVNDASIRYLFIGEQFQYDIAIGVFQVCPTLERLIIFDRKVKRLRNDTTSIYFDEFMELGKTFQHQKTVDERTSKASEDDIANILYTSGTTGEPKGVCLYHGAYVEQIRTHIERFPELTDKDISMDFLPLTHVFERGWTFICLGVGMQVAINLVPQDIQKTIKEVHPTCMCAVPRFWEKVYQGVQELIDGTSGVKHMLMLDAIKVGKKYNIDYLRFGKTPPLALRLKYKLYDKTVYSLLKKTVGIERGHFFPTAGAAIPEAVSVFIHSVGINMIAGYGLTESTATVSCADRTNYSISSVGRLMPGVEIKFGENDEILLRGKTITKGYYRKAEENKKAFTEDGWFRTGDAGYMKNGELFLTDRIKDLFKTSNGKYVAPQILETKLVVDRYIDQISIIANQRKFVSALIVPNYKLVEEYAKEKGLKYNGREELLKNEKVCALFKARIDTLQQQFSHYEQIKRFTLLPHSFSVEKGELTNTLKIKRNVLNEHYADEINKMYEE